MKNENNIIERIKSIMALNEGKKVGNTTVYSDNDNLVYVEDHKGTFVITYSKKPLEKRVEDYVTNIDEEFIDVITSEYIRISPNHKKPVYPFTEETFELFKKATREVYVRELERVNKNIVECQREIDRIKDLEHEIPIMKKDAGILMEKVKLL